MNLLAGQQQGITCSQIYRGCLELFGGATARRCSILFYFPLPACSWLGQSVLSRGMTGGHITALSSRMRICRAPGLPGDLKVYVCHGRPTGSVTAADLQPQYWADSEARCSI